MNIDRKYWVIGLVSDDQNTVTLYDSLPMPGARQAVERYVGIFYSTYSCRLDEMPRIRFTSPAT